MLGHIAIGRKAAAVCCWHIYRVSSCRPLYSDQNMQMFWHRNYAADSNEGLKKTKQGSKWWWWLMVPLGLGTIAVVSKRRETKPGYNWQVTLYRKIPLKTMSRWWGRINQYDLPVFLRRPLLNLYAWMFGCNLAEAAIEDLKHYRNLDEFFRRELKPHIRPVDENHVLTSPADGRVLHFGGVQQGILEQVKGVTYSLRGFLGEVTWSETQRPSTLLEIADQDYEHHLQLQPGNSLYHCVIYLAPGDYHRFHSPTDWNIVFRRHFPGELLSVSPGIARWVQGLFSFNERVVYIGNWCHGFFSMTAVGATNVGSIRIYCDEDLKTNIKCKSSSIYGLDRVFETPVHVGKGDMFGEFNLGSTIVLVFEAPKTFKFKIEVGQKVRFGEALGNCEEVEVGHSVNIPIANSVELPIANSADIPVANSAEIPVVNSVKVPILNSTDIPIANSAEIPVQVNLKGL